MSLIPWRGGRPLARAGEGEHPLAQMRRQMDELFGRFFQDPWGTGLMEWPGGEHAWTPRAELSETNKEYAIRLEVPGVKSEDIDLSISGNMLTIKGEKPEEKEEKKKNYLYSERHFGTFSRTMELPANVNPEKIDAKFKDGVLTVKLEKAPEAQSKRISVKTE